MEPITLISALIYTASREIPKLIEERKKKKEREELKRFLSIADTHSYKSTSTKPKSKQKQKPKPKSPKVCDDITQPDLDDNDDITQ